MLSISSEEKNMTMRVLIADDHAVFRSGLRALLEKEEDIEVEGEAGTGSETVKKVYNISPDILILDINMPDMNGMMVAKKVLTDHPDLKIVVLTMHDDEHYLREFLKIGVKGFVLKKSTQTEVVQAIRAASQDKYYIDSSLPSSVLSKYSQSPGKNLEKKKDILTPREQEICRLLAYGHTNSEVAEKLCVSERTAEFHRSNIFSKLNFKSRAELVRFAIETSLMKNS